MLRCRRLRARETAALPFRAALPPKSAAHRSRPMHEVCRASSASSLRFINFRRDRGTRIRAGASIIGLPADGAIRSDSSDTRWEPACIILLPARPASSASAWSGKFSERKGAKVYFLVRDESAGEAEIPVPLLGRGRQTRDSRSGGPDRSPAWAYPRPNRRSSPRWPSGISSISPRCTTCKASAEQQQAANVAGTRNVVAFADEIGAGCFHHVSSIAAAGLYEGVFREDMFEEAENLDHPYFSTKHESEKIVRERVQRALARLPAGDRGRRLGHRRDGQDRRSVLLLQADPAHAPVAAAVDAQHRHRGRAHQHRAGGFRGERDGPHRSRRGPTTASVSTWSTRSRCASAKCSMPSPRPRTRPSMSLFVNAALFGFIPKGIKKGHDGAHAGAPHSQRGDEGPRPARGHHDLHQLPDALRLPRGPACTGGQRHRGAAARLPMPGGCGTTGNATSIPICRSTAR